MKKFVKKLDKSHNIVGVDKSAIGVTGVCVSRFVQLSTPTKSKAESTSAERMRYINVTIVAKELI